MNRKNKKVFHVSCFMFHDNGFSLIELTITIGIIGILGMGLWSAWVIGLQVTTEKRAEVAATSIATEKIERLKTLPYETIGTAGGIPSGAIPQSELVTRNAITYTVKTAIFYIDDPFDGVAPTDTIPTDYKRARIEVSWSGKYGVSPVVLMTDVAPKGIESSIGGGTIMLRVVDALAEPVRDATVVIANTLVAPAINMTLTTDAQGQIMIPGAPASQESYDIRVTKNGYSSEATIRPEVGTNPSPTKPPLSVADGKVTETSFVIDRLSELTITTVDNRGSQGWWRSTWPYRKNITIENAKSSEAVTGTVVSIALNHAGLTQEGKSLTNGDDIRIVFWNGTYFEDLDRVNTTPWNTATTTLWFATKKSIPAGEKDENYAIYYGNGAPDSPPSSPSHVFPPPIGADTIGLWYLDEGKGSTIARDASGYGHDGTLQGLDPETAWVDGKFGSALSFNGVCCPQPHIRVAPTSTLANVDKITVEAWIYPTISSGDQTIVSKIDNSKSIGTYHLHQNYKSICLFVWKDPNPYDGRGCGGQVTLNAWNHVAGSYDGRFIRTYLNGTLVGTVEKPGILSKTQWVELNIGRYANHNWDPYKGLIDTVAIHRTARDSFAYGKPSSLTIEISTERDYKQPNAIPNVTATITGAKTIGVDDAGKPITKFTVTKTSNAQGVIALPDLEWDTYAITINGAATGYDIAGTLPLIPLALPPGSAMQERLTLLSHRSDTLLVTVKNKLTPLDGASVRLTNTTLGYDKTIITGEEGQSFFSPLVADITYDLTVTKPGHTTTTTSVYIKGQTYENPALSPL